MNRLIQTVTGPIEAAQMGRTFCHEHLIIGYAGWEGDLTRSGPFDRLGVEEPFEDLSREDGLGHAACKRIHDRVLPAVVHEHAGLRKQLGEVEAPGHMEPAFLAWWACHARNVNV